MSRRGGVLLALLAASAVVTILLQVGSAANHAAPGGVVQLSPGGNDGSCGRGAGKPACRTLQKALAVASAGDTIQVADGSYTGGGLSGSKAVTFRVAKGATATVTTMLELESLSNVKFFGPVRFTTRDNWDLRVVGCSSNLELHNFSGKYFDVADSARNIRIYGGDWGGYADNPPAGDSAIGGGYGYPGYSGCGDGWVRDVLIDGVRFHDVQFRPSSEWGDGHPDCLESHGAFENLTIRNSTFVRCGNTFFGLYTDWGSYDGLLIENNLMTTIADSFWGLQIGTKPGWSCANIVFRYNTYDPNNPDAKSGYANSPPLIDCPGKAEVYGNIIRRVPPGGDCRGASWSYNLIESGPKCGSDSLSGDAFFVARGSNYRLRPGSPAIGSGDPRRFPQRDADGDKRPVDGRPDAGFDEATGVVRPSTRAALASAGETLAASAAETVATGSAACAEGAVSQRNDSALNRLASGLTGSASSRANACLLFVAGQAAWSYAVSRRAAVIASTSSNRSFRSIAEPHVASHAPLGGRTPRAAAVAAAFVAARENGELAAATLVSYAITLARARAAGAARDAEWQDKQIAVSRRLARQAAAAIERQPALHTSLSRALAAAGLSNAPIDPRTARRGVAALRTGLPPRVRASLALSGARVDDLRTLERRARRVAPVALSRRGLLDVIADRRNAATFRSMAAALRRQAAAPRP